MATKFSEFISNKKIDPKRVLSASKKLERLRQEDRQLKLKKKQGASAEAPAADAEAGAAKPPPKPRSGRPVTKPLLNRALNGGPISGPSKMRLMRAVNYLLEQKKQDRVDLRGLF